MGLLGRLAVTLLAAAVVLCGCAQRADPAVPTTTAAAPTLRPDPSLSVPLPEGEWGTVTDPESRASILMPRPVKPRWADDNGVAAIVYTSNGVSMSVTRLPVGTRGDLQATVDRSVRSLGGRLLTSETLTVDGHPARDAIVEIPENRFIHMRVVVTSIHIVSALAGFADRASADANMARAFPTFHVP